jgi:hypothetical protein
MAAINTIAIRDAAMHQLGKRANWASENVGPMVVFCIVGVVGIGLISLWVYKFTSARRLRKTSNV